MNYWSKISCFICLTLIGLLTTLLSCQDEGPNNYILDINIVPLNGGKVSPLSGTYNVGDTIVLTAVANEYYTFNEWLEDSLVSLTDPYKCCLTLILDGQKNITATFALTDTDNDNISDKFDLCDDTPEGLIVDQNGCAAVQKDTDEDGVNDAIDICPNTPANENVDENGCHAVLGNYALGGVIFYIDETLNHGLVVALNDNESGEWGCSDEEILNANDSTLGSGYRNTLAILASDCEPAGISAIIAAYSASTFISEDTLVNDWYLPSIDELKLLYQEREWIDDSLTVYNGKRFENTTYWSSTQSGTDKAKSLSFGNGSTKSSYKISVNEVRSIRAF
ncbi:MAG: InlB B-repeat-containing protein [Cytophagales bacterium]|jgi:hypothetical protein